VKRFLILSFFVPTVLCAQTFTVVKDNAHGEIENQCITGTCWSFATVSFLESEIMRKGHEAVDLSEMFNARYIYSKKADSYVRFQGKQQFGPGGLSHDVLQVVDEVGMVPESAYSGFVNGATTYNHNELDAELETLVKAAVETGAKQGYMWKKDLEAALDKGIGPLPNSFEYKGKKYTPASFRDEMKITSSEYVCLTSFSHHPFYKTFVLEVPDNWSKKAYFNVSIDELQQIADNAINTGFTIAWDADVSEDTFDARKGIAYMGKLQEETAVTQASRQLGFDTYATTDDHLMHITGMAKDEKGNVYYMAKNSWGPAIGQKGYIYASASYFRAKTICIVVSKDAMPLEIRKRLGI
jgi:bleomycin hydrolase